MSRVRHPFHGNIWPVRRCKILPFTVVLLTIPFFWEMMSHQWVIAAHPNPLVCSIGNYTLADLHCQYKKYIHKEPKHLLL